jgi:hypothetical protein
MNELHWMVALEKRAEMVQAIEKAHLIEEMQSSPAPKVHIGPAAFAMAASAAAVLLLIVVSKVQ